MEGENSVGKSRTLCDIAINIQGLSEEHAKVVVDAGFITIEDLASQQGLTYGGNLAQITYVCR